MKYFTNLPAMANWIRHTHSLFGLCPVSMALDILGRANTAMMANKAITGITFQALQYIPDYGYLKTYCTVGRDKRGAWYLSESTNCPK